MVKHWVIQWECHQSFGLEASKAHFGWIDSFLPGPAENNAACYFDACQFTDDTSMALALADAIIECDGEISPEIIARNVLSWAEGFDAFNKTFSVLAQKPRCVRLKKAHLLMSWKTTA